MFKEDEKGDAKIARNFSNVVDSMANKWILLRFIWLGIVANFLIWVSVFLLPTTIYTGFGVIGKVSSKIMVGLLGIPLIFTTLTVYALFRLKFPDIEEQKLDSEIMSSVVYQSNSAKRFWIRISSFAVGVTNTGLLILADLTLSKAIQFF